MRPILILFQQFKYPLFSASIWSAIANRIAGVLSQLNTAFSLLRMVRLQWSRRCRPMSARRVPEAINTKLQTTARNEETRFMVPLQLYNLAASTACYWYARISIRPRTELTRTVLKFSTYNVDSLDASNVIPPYMGLKFSLVAATRPFCCDSKKAPFPLRNVMKSPLILGNRTPPRSDTWGNPQTKRAGGSF